MLLRNNTFEPFILWFWKICSREYAILTFIWSIFQLKSLNFHTKIRICLMYSKNRNFTNLFSITNCLNLFETKFWTIIQSIFDIDCWLLCQRKNAIRLQNRFFTQCSRKCSKHCYFCLLSHCHFVKYFGGVPSASPGYHSDLRGNNFAYRICVWWNDDIGNLGSIQTHPE